MFLLSCDINLPLCSEHTTSNSAFRRLKATCIYIYACFTEQVFDDGASLGIVINQNHFLQLRQNQHKVYASGRKCVMKLKKNISTHPEMKIIFI